MWTLHVILDELKIIMLQIEIDKVKKIKGTPFFL